MAKYKKSADLKSELTEIEKRELEAILDRLSVQNPNGESFQSWVDSLKTAFSQRERLLAAFLDTLSRSPTEAGLRVFNALKDSVKDKALRKVVKAAEYRLEQKGLLKKESASEPVVIFSEKNIRSKDLELAEAHIWLLPLCGRFCVTLYVPSMTAENSIIAVGSDLIKWAEFMIGKAIYPDDTIMCYVLRGSKKVYKEVTSSLDIPRVVSVPVSLPIAAVFVQHLIGVSLKGNKRLYPSDTFQARRVTDPFVPDADIKDSFMRELDLSSDDMLSVNQPDTSALLESLGYFWTDPDEMHNILRRLLEIVDSVLVWDTAAKEYQVRRKVLEFLNSLDEFYKELYCLYLLALALIQGKGSQRRAEAAAILKIVSDIKAGNADTWEDVTVLHFCQSILSFVRFIKARDELAKEMTGKRSDLIVVPGGKAVEPKWDYLDDFLTKMVTDRR